MYDALDILQTAVTVTATNNGAGKDLKTGTPRRGQVARFLITSYISAATAGSVFTCSIQESDDNTTFTTLAAAPPLTGGTAAANKEAFVPFSTIKRYVRAVMTISPSSGTPSATYSVDLGQARP